MASANAVANCRASPISVDGYARCGGGGRPFPAGRARSCAERSEVPARSCSLQCSHPGGTPERPGRCRPAFSSTTAASVHPLTDRSGSSRAKITGGLRCPDVRPRCRRWQQPPAASLWSIELRAVSDLQDIHRRPVVIEPVHNPVVTATRRPSSRQFPLQRLPSPSWIIRQAAEDERHQRFGHPRWNRMQAAQRTCRQH